jgi:hypothetical protein
LRLQFGGARPVITVANHIIALISNLSLWLWPVSRGAADLYKKTRSHPAAFNWGKFADDVIGVGKDLGVAENYPL